MRAHLAYLRYVLIHKFYVLWGGIRLGAIPFWQLIIHDASKFSKAEWLPYVRQFYNADGSQRKVRDATGAFGKSLAISSALNVSTADTNKCLFQ